MCQYVFLINFFKIPVILLILLFIPIVDYTIENHGWTKLLNSLQIITLPIGIILIKQCNFYSYIYLEK